MLFHIVIHTDDLNGMVQSKIHICFKNEVFILPKHFSKCYKSTQLVKACIEMDPFKYAQEN